MQRKFLSVLMVVLTTAFAFPCHAADRPALLSEGEVQRYGLTRAWYAQIKIDGRLTSIEHSLLDRDTLFIVTSNCDLIALNAETGKTLWTRRVSDALLLPYAPAANSRTVGIVCGNEVSVFDRRNGRLLWHQVLPSTPTAACQMSDYFLYVPLIDNRMACFPLEELRAPSPALLALVPQYEAIGYTLDPHTGKVTRASNQIVSEEQFVISHKGETKPKPSPSLLALVPKYAEIGIVLDPYTGKMTEADGPITQIAAPVDTRQKGKKELDDLLADELIRLAMEHRLAERDRRLTAQQAKDEAEAQNVDIDANAPYYLKPWTSVPLVCYSFGTAHVQPVVSYESGQIEAVTWFTDRGYLFIAQASRKVDSSQQKDFTLEYRIAVSPMSSFLKESKVGRFHGSIARDVAYQPAVVQKVIDDDDSRFLVVVGSGSGFVFAYDPKTSETRWWQSLGSPISSSPTVVGERVYVPCLDGYLCCLDSRNGRILWRSPGIDSFISASQGVVETQGVSELHTRIYAKNVSGDLVAIDGKNGGQTTLFSIKNYEDTYYNSENDRIYLITNSGLIQCLHEIGKDTPARHTYLPEAYLDYVETDEERRLLVKMPEIRGGGIRQLYAPSRTGTTTTSPGADDSDTLGFGNDDDDFPFLPPTTVEPEQPDDDDDLDFDFDFDAIGF